MKRLKTTITHNLFSRTVRRNGRNLITHQRRRVLILYELIPRDLSPSRRAESSRSYSSARGAAQRKTIRGKTRTRVVSIVIYMYKYICVYSIIITCIILMSMLFRFLRPVFILLGYTIHPHLPGWCCVETCHDDDVGDSSIARNYYYIFITKTTTIRTGRYTAFTRVCSRVCVCVQQQQ